MVWDLYTPLGKRKSSMTTLENITLFMASLLKPHPGRDWMIIFILTLMIGIACMVIAGYLFIAAKQLAGSIDAGRGDRRQQLALRRRR